MSPSADVPPLLPTAPPGRVLRRLFLTLFLRGRSSRGLQKDSAPKSVGQKLAVTLIFYALFGMFSLGFLFQPVFVLAVYLHTTTFIFLGMFVAGSAGEVLFNKEESDILLHRPVTARSLLWAKVGVMAQISLWIAGAFNLAGLFAGVSASDGGWLFPLAHTVSTVLHAMFCAGCVVMVYQLCLRWFGRERLDGLMTITQVLVSIAIVVGSQMLPRIVVGRTGRLIEASARSWWIGCLPPAWFAGFDDALAGSGAVSSWVLAGLALAATTTVLGLAFGKLARDYERGLQTLSESGTTKPKGSRRRYLDALVKAPPLRWWLRDSVARAAFLLTVAYLVRDREVKLRVYPGLAPMLVFPIFFLLPTSGDAQGGGGFGVAFAGGYMGLIPLLSLNLLQYSQQWQAADLFRAAPMQGPASLCHGARRAVLCVLTAPTLLLFGLIVWLLVDDRSQLALLLPGLIALPVYSLLPCLKGKAVPLSSPSEEAKSANRGITMLGAILVAMVMSGLASWAWASHWFCWFLLIEGAVVAVTYARLYASLRRARWTPME